MEIDEKKYRLHTLAERGWRLAVDIALEGLRLAEKGAGLAVVADETRRISAELEAAMDTGNDVAELLEQFTLLVLNGSIEALHAQSKTGTAGTMTLLLGELRCLMDGIATILGLPSASLAVIPEPSENHPVCGASIHLFHASRHGIRFAENLDFIREIVRYEASSGNDAPRAIEVRGCSIPLAEIARKKFGEAYGQLGQRRNQALIVRADRAEPDRLFAVPVDSLAINCIARCRLGASVPYTGTALEASFVRDAWDAAEGQICFPDWRALAAR